MDGKLRPPCIVFCAPGHASIQPLPHLSPSTPTALPYFTQNSVHAYPSSSSILPSTHRVQSPPTNFFDFHRILLPPVPPTLDPSRRRVSSPLLGKHLGVVGGRVDLRVALLALGVRVGRGGGGGGREQAAGGLGVGPEGEAAERGVAEGGGGEFVWLWGC